MITTCGFSTFFDHRNVAFTQTSNIILIDGLFSGVYCVAPPL